MAASPIIDESSRLAAVRRYDALAIPPDGAFERIARMAARLTDTPIATISIVDEDRIWFPATHGLDVTEIAHEPGLCASAVLQPDPYVVTDASLDPRTLDNSLVRGELGLRFYVGIPLRTADGHGLGTLNVIDVAPRSLRPGELEHLQDLAAIVMDELELRLAARGAVAAESQRVAAGYRDTLLAGISHELRTPIAKLQGVASLAAATPPTDIADAQLRAVLTRQVRHLDWLVGQYLDFALLESQHHEPTADLAPLTLTEVVEQATELFRDRATIVLDVEPGLPQALADLPRTQRIVTELLNNAVRFAGTRAPIRVEVGWGDDPELVRVSVVDAGPGIPADQLTHLFDRFTRDPRSTGTGVGLFVSRANAEVQGGRIEVVSTPGAGSCFTLLLRRAH
ncbi:GAF domain-containing sensor histidine kinase [Egicoccus halophilus]|uniref:histidine kinase n=1 Tax=Egicoccus halophilus TaxID=1670830 RepID=A0A8J3AD29_9ACTN|nr:GAF domain-containing sensor histidine kinase [Egicoccus halophilus]GGI09064.1 sensor histidine kinase [Egicoccus halophilus]